MTVSVSSYQLKTAGFSEDQVKSILSYAVGFNPRSVKITFPKDEFNKVFLEEKTMGVFANSSTSADKIIGEENVRFVAGQLEAWAGSSSQGSAMAERAAVVIRALAERINELENPSK